MAKNPVFIELRRIDAAKEIALRLGQSRNKVYIDSDALLLNLTQGLDHNLEKKIPGQVSTFVPHIVQKKQ